MPIIKALRTSISDGNQQYPLFLGYLSAADLHKVAAVPSFTEESNNYEIADNILGDPVEDWQRPPIDWKVDAIRDRFSQTNEIMPNPVLLAVNKKSLVNVTQQVLNGQTTEIFEISVTPGPNGEKPLWILDGQHRVLGLSKSSRSSNSVPLVLLHSDGAPIYAPKQFAKIFAEVTTLATPLQAIHSDWLQFAFNLGPYTSKSSADWKAMRSVADLCRAQTFADGAVTNPFFDKIAFNPETGGSPAHGRGFEFNCTGLKELIRDHYYGQPHSGTNMLEPAELAHQIAIALQALIKADTTTTAKSAFFGENAVRQKYMEEGFVVGVLTYLRKHGTPPSWSDVLANLGFSTANWDFSGWVVTTGGNVGTLSKSVANACFKQIFGDASLPKDVSDLPTYLRGDAAGISFRSSPLTPKQHARRSGYVDHSLPISGIKKVDIGDRRHLKLNGLTANVGQLEVRDKNNVLSNEYSSSALRRGVVLPDGGGSIELMIGAALYGGTRQPPLTLEIVWK